MAEETLEMNQVQDTARWVAMARALESERKDALFQDPFARKLAGARGEALNRRLSRRIGGTWPIVARTHIVDGLVLDAVREGADAVLNLAAGFDTRPYRLALPAALTWIEVDHADVISGKEVALAAEKSKCVIERVALDLARVDERRALFATLSQRFRRVLVITEGLLYYLSEAAAMSLAKDLAEPPSFFRWIVDLLNSKVIQHLATRSGGAFQGTARMQFGADAGPVVFEPLGWRVIDAQSVFKAAGRIKRLPFPMSLFALLPEQKYGSPKRPWAGVCVLEPASLDRLAR